MTVFRIRRSKTGQDATKRKSSAYRPIELNGEIKAATSGIQVIDGNDFDRRVHAHQNGRRKVAQS